MEAKIDMAVNEIFADLFSCESGIADNQTHVSAVTPKRKWILKHEPLYIFQKIRGI